ncbi:MAG: O-methyltransferase [Erysipelotrichaceae bacterium]
MVEKLIMKEISEIEAYAKDHNVPIMQIDGIQFLCDYVKEHSIITILEIGTAIGYSAIRMALMNENIHIVSIERDQERYLEAINNIKDFNLDHQIKVIQGDAFDVEVEGEFDLIFIDAAKAQYIKFFERFTPYLKQGGVVFSDNLAFHGFVQSDTEIKSRGLRALVRKIRNYIDYLKNNPEFETVFFEIGDGIAISKKK